MRKTLRVVGIVAALAFLVAPAVVGFVAEHRLRTLVAQAGSEDGTGPALTAYDRGWFGARSSFSVPLTGPLSERLARWLGDAPGDPVTLLVDSDIRHGPVAGMNAAGVSVATAESRLRLQRGDDVVPIPGIVHSRLNGSGRLTLRYVSGPGFWTAADASTLEWTSADIQGEFPASGRFVATCHLDGLSLAGAAGTLAAGALTLEADAHRTRFGFWAGRARLATPLLLAATDEASFSAKDVELVSDQRVAGDVTNYRLTMAAGSIGGRDWNGVDARAKLRIDGIDARAFGQLVAQGAEPSGVPGLADLTALLVPGASVTLETLNLPTAHGAVLADFGITLPQGSTETDAAGIAYLLTMEGQGRIEMPRQLAYALSRRDERFRDTLNRLLRLRMLRPVAGNYLLEAAYGGGLLTVNGFPVPLPFVAH